MVNTDPGKCLGVVYTALPRALGCICFIMSTAVVPEWLYTFTLYQTNKPSYRLKHWRAQGWDIRAIFTLSCLQSKRLYCPWARGGPGTAQPHSLIQVVPLSTPGVSWLHSHLSSNMLQPRNIVQSKINIVCILQRWPTLVTTEFCVKTLTRPVELREEGLWEEMHSCDL